MRRPLMLQRWHEITFLHWSCNPDSIQRLLPPGLTVDTFEGKAWISMTPFLLRGLRPPFMPAAVSMDFPEINLRTYVSGRQGSGIWFFSLDAGKLLPVLGARTMFGLPYYWAKMRVDVGTNENAYESDRRGGAAKVRIRILKGDPISDPSSLDNFLTARFRLYSTWASRLIVAEVEHPPWQLRRVRILQLEESVRRRMSVEFPSMDFVAHHSIGVDTEIAVPSRV